MVSSRLRPFGVGLFLAGVSSCALVANLGSDYEQSGGVEGGDASDAGAQDSSPDDASSAEGGGGGFLATLTANGTHVCAIVGGVVYGWGADGNGQVGPYADCGALQCAEPAAVTFDGGAAPVQVAAGVSHSCALFGDQSALCWGDNGSGELGVGPTPLLGGFGRVMGGPYVQISAGNAVTCALGADGGVFCWGDNSAGSLGAGNLDASVQVSAPVVNLSGAVEIALGVQLACARLEDGGVDCWGTNATPSGDFPCEAGAICTPAPLPVSLGDAGRATRLSVGGNHACAVMEDTTVRCWGYNASGQLGDGTTTSSSDAVLPRFANGFGSVTGAVDIGCGLTGTCAVLGDGGVACWGDVSTFRFGETGTSPFLVAALSSVRHASLSPSDSTFACFQLEDGGVSCAGHNEQGEQGRGVCEPADTSENFCALGPVSFP